MTHSHQSFVRDAKKYAGRNKVGSAGGKEVIVTENKITESGKNPVPEGKARRRYGLHPKGS